MKKIIFLICILFSMEIFSEENTVSIPMLPLIPASPTEIEDKNQEIWELEKISTIMMENRVKVVVPLEIISDVEIKALVVDDEKLEIPFEIEMNKEPDKKDHYMLNYTATELDLDEDGRKDTKIYSPKYINKKIVDENVLYIDGANITKEGVHRKRVYINIEVKDGR